MANRRSYNNDESFMVLNASTNRWEPWWIQSRKYQRRSIAHPRVSQYNPIPRSHYEESAADFWFNWNDELSSFPYLTAVDPKNPKHVASAITRNRKAAIKRRERNRGTTRRFIINTNPNRRFISPKKKIIINKDPNRKFLVVPKK